jgi:hypothetical protein
VTGLQSANHGLNGTAIDAFLINWDHIQLWQKPAEGRRVQQRSPGQKVNRSVARNPCKERIKITLMIHCQNRRPALNHSLPMNYTKPKKQSPGQTRKVIPKPVIEIHFNKN